MKFSYKACPRKKFFFCPIFQCGLSVLEDLLQVMQKQLEKLASLNVITLKPCQQLMESKALTDEAISAILTQKEALKFEYPAGVAELRDRLRVSSSTDGEAAVASQSSTNSAAALHTLPLAPPVFTF